MTDYDEVVHVETLKEYRAVLDKWFDKGYDWGTTLHSQDLHEVYFNRIGARYLTLEADRIGYSFGLVIDKTKATPFKEFMAKELGKVTYGVSEEQMKFIKEAKGSAYPATYLMCYDSVYKAQFSGVEYGSTFERDLLRYLGGDDSVVFQLKDPLFMLKGKDTDGDAVYFRLNTLDVPTYTYDKPQAFVASLKVITRWNTPFWEIVRVEA